MYIVVNPAAREGSHEREKTQDFNRGAAVNHVRAPPPLRRDYLRQRLSPSPAAVTATPARDQYCMCLARVHVSAPK